MTDARFGAKPNPLPSPTAIVRYGLTRRERLLLAKRDTRVLAALDSYDRNTRDEILALCDRFAERHG